jgi:hypothetical protein
MKKESEGIVRSANMHTPGKRSRLVVVAGGEGRKSGGQTSPRHLLKREAKKVSG